MISGIQESTGRKKNQLQMTFEEVQIDDVLEIAYHKSRKKNHEEKICKCCGHSFIPTHGSQSYCSPQCKRNAKNAQALLSYHKKRENQQRIDEINVETKNCTKGRRKCTLCLDCKNIVPNPEKNIGCSWSINFVPVDGWEAIKNQKGRYESYKVIQCPNFKRG